MWKVISEYNKLTGFNDVKGIIARKCLGKKCVITKVEASTYLKIDSKIKTSVTLKKKVKTVHERTSFKKSLVIYYRISVDKKRNEQDLQKPT